jgi:hypothetical protein
MGKYILTSLLVIILTSNILKAQIPNDPYYQYQFYLQNINIEDAWDITKGDPSVLVTMLDSGFDLHEDIDQSKMVGLSQSWENNAHGMAIMGILAAQHNSIGIAGIAPNVRYQGFKVFTPQGFIGDDAVKDLIELADERGSRLITNSWQSEVPLDAVEDAITEGGLLNPFIFIVATGNDGFTANSVKYPAKYPEALAVGAVDENGVRYNYSGYGPEIDIVGPSGPSGVELQPPCGSQSGQNAFQLRGTIWTFDIPNERGYNPGDFNTDPSEECWNYFEYNSQSNTPNANNNYHSHFAGTSAPTPMVAGVAALMLSVNPNIPRLSVYSILQNTARKVPSMNGQNRTDEHGFGIVDAYAALKEALPEQFDNNTFTSSTTINSAHIDGNTTLGNGVTLTIAANEVAVIEGSIVGAATNTHINVQGKLIIDYNTDISRIHLEVEDGGELLIRSGATFEFSTGQWNNIWVKPGGQITAKGTLSDPIVIKQLDSGTRWSQIGLQSSETNTFEWVVFDGGNKTVGIASQNNIFKHCTFKNGVRGISGWHNQDGSGQSHATISYSIVENNSTVGVVAQYADIEMFHTDIKNNGQAGLYVHSSTVYPFHRNDVSNNGTSSSRDGIEVLSSGNILLQDFNGSQPRPGYNVISNNSDDQISVSGLATLGFAINYTGGYNSITGPYGFSNRYLVDNNTSTALPAMFNYWGGNLSSSMFDGGLSKLYNEQYFLTNDDVIEDENPGYQLISKSTNPQLVFSNTDELYEYHRNNLYKANNGRDIRFNLNQMFLVSRASKINSPEILESFKNLLVNNSDENQNRFGDIRKNKVLRDLSKLLTIKTQIADGDYQNAAEFIDTINPS